MSREGRPAPASTYFFSRALFLKCLGAIYLIAFVSLWVQLEGLIGRNGILPAAPFLEGIKTRIGLERYWLLPTLFWLNAGDGFMHFSCAAGMFLSLGLLLGIRPGPVLLALWVLYLSFVTVGQDFFEFQWDNLLLEAGFLGIFLGAGSDGVLWLFRWLLFRLVFSSGVVKLASGDLTWRNFTALDFHYETQPLPTWIGWYAHQLPAWFQKFSVLITHASEIVVPFLIFARRRYRLFGCGAVIVFQILIAATGNYCFFNLLTLALCLFLIDDGAWPGRWSERFRVESSPLTLGFTKWMGVPLAGIILVMTSVQMVHLFRFRVPWPAPVAALYRAGAPFRSVNSYGLFAVMTTSRPEIVLEGSNDRKTWQAYEFKWKPGDLRRRPGFVAPHQPRLDWQMWFAALGDYRENPWFINFMARVLEGSPEVLSLLKKNPFPGKPPRYLRAVVYDYHFTDIPTLRSTGAWWRRQARGLYCPILSREPALT